MEFTNRQIMCTLSYIAYLGVTNIGSNEENAKKIFPKIKKNLEELPPVKGDWELVWGPSVYKFTIAFFDNNMMFIVRNVHDPDKYVVVIRGTNFVSLSDWVVEDFLFIKQLPWKYGDPLLTKKARISRSTQIGLDILSELTPPQDIPGTGATILDFFKKELESREKIDICVTGHSLGGTLASTTALWLTDTQGEVNVSDNLLWDKDKKAAISAVAFAGATAGNKGFAKYSDTRLGDNCERIYNTHDVVPYAWSASLLRKLKKLYSPHAKPGFFLRLIMIGAIWKSMNKGYAQLNKNVVSLPGKVNIGFKSYIKQMAYQHVVAYVELLEIEEYIDIEEYFPHWSQLMNILE